MFAVNKITDAARALLLLVVLLPAGARTGSAAGTWERCQEENSFDLRQFVAPNQPPNYDIISLELNNCHGNELKFSDFNMSLPNLQYIFLENNNLRSVNPAVFNAFPKVSHLFLDSNNLTAVPVFKGASVPNLETLVLRNNQISALENPETFSSTKLLKELNLNNNLIEYINPAVLRGLLNLEKLFLTSNKLTYIPNAMFAIPSLRALHLRSNLIEYVSPGAFSGTRLEHLYINDNRLTHLPEHFVAELTSAGGKLSYLLFYNNPLQCGCLSELLVEVRQLVKCEYGANHYNDPENPACVQAEETQCKRLSEAEYWSQRPLKTTDN